MVCHEEAGPDSPNFLFATCQVGAERALKTEMRRRWPAFHFAYSRPGFLTFKLPSSAALADDFDLDCVFARSYGFTLGKVTADGLEALAGGVWLAAGERSFDALHVWQRDMARPGWHGFEPHVTPAAVEAEAAIRAHWPAGEGAREAPHPRIAQPGQRVLDCVLVESEEWWIGWHRARSGESCFPGALRDIGLPADAVSRAYLKIVEALEWSALPIERGHKMVELGCAPGGASQALLARGLVVVGIDPARVDPRVLAERNFTHIHKRAADVRRRDFRGVAWLAADMNVAPQTALDTVEAIVTHPTVSIRGLLLTLKLLDWKMADEIPCYLERIRGWGYVDVRASQLAHNRQEFCVAAVRGSASRRRRTPAAKRIRSKGRRS